MTKVLLLTVVAFVCCPSVAAAQHPCDEPAPTEYREPAPKLEHLKLGFCYRRDSDARVGFLVQINNEQDIDLGVLQPLTRPNAEGMSYYETGTMSLRPGILTIKAYTAVGVSAPSAPITLTVNGKPETS